jgi:DinB superfamily
MSVFTNPSNSTPQQIAAYVAALLDLVGDTNPLTILRDTPTALVRTTAGVPGPLVRQPESPGKWSIAQVLQHLADSEVVWAWRMRLVLAQERPQLTGYDQDLWASRLGYELANPSEALEEFSVLRRANLRLLERATPEDLQRVGVHAERGEESLGHLRRLYAGHDLLHLRQINRILAAVRPAG